MRIKRIFALLLSCLLSLTWFACSWNAAQSEGTATTIAPIFSSPSLDIVYPMTRAGNRSTPSYLYNNEYKNLYELWYAADAVVRVRIGNWLMQTDCRSYYQAQTLECYK